MNSSSRVPSSLGKYSIGPLKEGWSQGRGDDYGGGGGGELVPRPCRKGT